LVHEILADRVITPAQIAFMVATSLSGVP